MCWNRQELHNYDAVIILRYLYVIIEVTLYLHYLFF